MSNLNCVCINDFLMVIFVHYVSDGPIMNLSRSSGLYRQVVLIYRHLSGIHGQGVAPWVALQWSILAGSKTGFHCSMYSTYKRIEYGVTSLKQTPLGPKKRFSLQRFQD